MTIPVGLLYAVVPILVASGIGFTVWIVQQLARHAALLERTAARLEHDDSRLGRLEAFQDGMQAGRAIEQATRLRPEKP